MPTRFESEAEFEFESSRESIDRSPSRFAVAIRPSSSSSSCDASSSSIVPGRARPTRVVSFFLDVRVSRSLLPTRCHSSDFVGETQVFDHTQSYARQTSY